MKPESSNQSSGSAFKLKSIGLTFKEELSALMDKLNATRPHYIRCIKPNSDQVWLHIQALNGPVFVSNSGYLKRGLHWIRCTGRRGIYNSFYRRPTSMWWSDGGDSNCDGWLPDKTNFSRVRRTLCHYSWPRCCTKVYISICRWQFWRSYGFRKANHEWHLEKTSI